MLTICHEETEHGIPQLLGKDSELLVKILNIVSKFAYLSIGVTEARSCFRLHRPDYHVRA